MTTIASQRSDLRDQRIPSWPGELHPDKRHGPSGADPVYTITPSNWVVLDSDDTYYQLKDPATGQIVWFYSIDLEFGERETVNITPSWQNITQTLLSIYRAVDNPKVLKDIEEEFDRMARLADAYVEEHQ